MRKGLLGVVSVVLSIGVSGCSTEPPDNGDAATSQLHGVDLANKRVRIGALNGESGPAAVIGKPYAVGKRMLVRQVNEGDSGLLPDGWTLELLERDHGYNPQRAVQLFNEIRDDVLFLATSFGTPNTLPLRPMLERNKIVAYPASLSSKMSEFEWTPPVGPSYIVEGQRAMDWVVESVADKSQIKAAVISQQDDYGKDGYDGWMKAAKFHGVEVVAEESYAPGQADYTAVVAALKKAGATHVMLASLPSATGPILGAALQLDYFPVWVGNTPSWIDRFFDASVIPPKVFDNFHLASGVPFWGEASPFMDRFLAAYEKYGRQESQPDGYILMSYMQGVLALEVLKRAIEKADLSRDGYVDALHSITDYRLQGAINYSINLSQVPYVAGIDTRIMKPKLAEKSWEVVAPFAAPQSPH